MSSKPTLQSIILDTVRAAGHPISIRSVLDKMPPDTRQATNLRTVREHIYSLRTKGQLRQVGIGSDTRYEIPTTPTNETQRQAHGNVRLATDPDPVYIPATEPTREQQAAELHDLGFAYVFGDIPDDGALATAPPAAVVVVEQHRPATSDQADQIAHHIGQNVALTVRQLIADALGEQAAHSEKLERDVEKLGALNDQLLADLDAKEAQIATLKTELQEQEALYNELDEKYNAYRKRISALAAAE